MYKKTFISILLLSLYHFIIAIKMRYYRPLSEHLIRVNHICRNPHNFLAQGFSTGAKTYPQGCGKLPENENHSQ